MSPSTKETFRPVSFSTRSSDSERELLRLSMTVMSWPPSSNRRIVCDPMYPQPPVMSILMVLPSLIDDAPLCRQHQG